MGSKHPKEYKIPHKKRSSISFNEEDKSMSPLQNNSKKASATLNQKEITVIVPLNSSFWKKLYNIETSLNQIASDFLQENNIIIPKNCFIEWSFKNNIINMDFNPLKSLIKEDMNKIYIAQEIKPIPGTENLQINNIIDIVGKPFSNPFEIFTFEMKKKLIKIRLYNQEKIKSIQLDNYGIESAYCNGNNHLFISGGVNQTTNETIGLFWDINIMNNEFRFPIEMFPKKNHSMIYIEKKVYIIGGDDVNTMYYEEDSNEIKNWANLNYKRFEPSLIKHDNYLFCFDSSKKYINNFNNIFNFEKIDLNSHSAEWELINPQISPNIINTIFYQKFYGLVEDFRENIIFIGGIYNNNKNGSESDINNNECMNIQYNINKNIMEKSDIEFKNISFSEKSFLPLDYNTYIILPNFNKHYPEVVYFYKNKNRLDISQFHPNLKTKIKNIKTTQIKPSLYGLNFDMPKSNNIFINDFETAIRLANKNNSYNNSYFFEENIKSKNEKDKTEDMKIISPKNSISNNEINMNQIQEQENKESNKKIFRINRKEEEEEKEEERKEEEIKEKQKEDIKEEIKSNNEKIEKLNQKHLVKIFYIEKPNSLIKFHSSISNTFNENSNKIINNNIRNKIKKKNIVPPKEISIRSIKENLKKFIK